MIAQSAILSGAAMSCMHVRGIFSNVLWWLPPTFEPVVTDRGQVVTTFQNRAGQCQANWRYVLQHKCYVSSGALRWSLHASTLQRPFSNFPLSSIT